MRQNEATAKRPFYAVNYQYKRAGTLYSCNRFGDDGKTMSGTDDFELAKRTAQRCMTEPGIVYACVYRTKDGYNHETVFEVVAEGKKESDENEK